MIDQIQLTRRQILAGSACVALSGCATAPAARMLISAWSIFNRSIIEFLPKLPVELFNGVLANRLDAYLVAHASSASPEKTSADRNQQNAAIAALVEEARKSNIDINLAMKLADSAGMDPVVDCLRNGIAIWCRGGRYSNQSVNGFDVLIENRTTDVIGGQFEFAIEDAESRIRDGQPYWRDPFELDPGQQTTFRYTIDDDFERLGLKQVSVLSQPDGISIRANRAQARVFDARFGI